MLPGKGNLGFALKSKKYNAAGRYSTGDHHLDFYQSPVILLGTATLSWAATPLTEVLHRKNCQISNPNPF